MGSQLRPPRPPLAFSQIAGIVASLAAHDLVAFPACAQTGDWPNHALTLVVPFSPGGSSDVIARIVADGLSNQLHQPVIVENISGAGGTTGTNRVAKAAPDGYQFVIGNVGTFAQSQWLYKKPLYNAAKDFAPVALISDEALVLVARSDLPANNLQEFIAFTKANQSKLRYSSSGVGGSNHLACLLLNTAIGIDVAHIPYRTVTQAVQDLIAGRVDYQCLTLPAALPQITGKTLKAIAILTRSRSAALPELPSAHEQGLTDFDVPTWYAFFLPRETPRSIVEKLNRATILALETPSVQQRLKQLGGDLVARERRSPEYLADFLAEEIKRWETPIKTSGVEF
jgi:tripartite-type tricarboxylate transporter receptor subunit TctC